MSAPATSILGLTQNGESRTDPSQQDIANLAYVLWQKRGSTDSSSEQNWIEAERRLRGEVATADAEATSRLKAR